MSYNNNNNTSSYSRYKDIDISFIAHPDTGDISALTDSNAINKSIRNLILTNYYERLHKHDKAGYVEGLLFENATPITENELRTRITDTIENYEPRAELQDVFVRVNEDANAFEVRIIYFATISIETVEYSFMLERVI